MVVKGELVFIPAPAIGHLTSMVQLANHLLLLNSDLSITILLSKPLFDTKLTAYVNSFTSNDDQTKTTRIKFIHLPPPQLDKLDDFDPFNFMNILVQTVWPFVKEAASHIVQNSTSLPGSPRLAGFVLDIFLVPFVDLANELCVPSYVFYTSGAAFLGFGHYLIQLHEKHEVNIELKGSDVEFNIPSYLNPVSSKFFPTSMLSPQFFHKTDNTTRQLKEVKGIMINTFLELESHALSYLRDDDTLPPVYPVGPLLNLNRASEVHDDLDIVKWLDEQPPSSVVFLCFGSMGSFNEDQVKEIACALEQSGHRFLWSLRKPSYPAKGMNMIDNDMSEALPEGFLARTSSIGKIIGWAPQVAILGHPAVGGFVSHCGWNSTLESIWFEVPMATWPLFSDQQLNAFQLVIDLGLAVEIKMDYKNDFLPSDEVVEIVSAAEIVKGIRCLMEQDSVVRKRVKEMSEKSRKALMNGGSSHSALHCLINDFMVNIS